MESLVNYESDEDVREQDTEKNTKLEMMGEIERDVNYDHVEMDESDEEGTTNEANTMMNVLPEDAPLVFRSRSKETESQNRRNSSDMEMDEDDEIIGQEEDQHSKLIEIETFFVADEGSKNVKATAKFEERNNEKSNKLGNYCMVKKDKSLEDCMVNKTCNLMSTAEIKTRTPLRRYQEDRKKMSDCERRRRISSRSPEPAKRLLGIRTGMVSYKSQVKDVERKTGITLPTYYNPGVMNPFKYAQQIQKRKLLWSKKSTQTKPNDEATISVWGGTTFKGDEDGKMTEKFKRLMGMKCKSSAENSSSHIDVVKKQEEMFYNMEAQYQVARMVTHSHRGLGLGYTKFQPSPHNHS